MSDQFKGRQVGPLRQRFETLRCFWCGAVDDVGGKQSPVAQSRGEQIPEGWLHVYVNMEYVTIPGDQACRLEFEDGDDMRLGCFFVCSQKCQADMNAAVKVAEESYVAAITMRAPRTRPAPKLPNEGEEYDATYEECMGCTSERCRGAGFLDVKLAGGNVGLICQACVIESVKQAISRPHSLTKIRLNELADLIQKGINP